MGNRRSSVRAFSGDRYGFGEHSPLFTGVMVASSSFSLVVFITASQGAAFHEQGPGTLLAVFRSFLHTCRSRILCIRHLAEVQIRPKKRRSSAQPYPQDHPVRILEITASRGDQGS